MSDSICSHVLRQYAVERKVGAGSYGHVWRCQKRSSSSPGGKIYALKKVCDAFDNSTDAQRTFREVVILLELTPHPNVVGLYDVYKSQDNRHLYLVFDYVESDLQVAISAHILQPVHQQFVLYQMLCALKFLHSANVVHRDLKPSNILLNESCTVKVCDFGFSRTVSQEEEAREGASLEKPVSSAARTGAHSADAAGGSSGSRELVLTDGVSTRWFRAPEILFGSTQYDQTVDIWSLGCILGEMIRGSPIFAGESILHQLQLIFALLGRPSEGDIAELAVDCRRFAKEIMPCVTEFSELPPTERSRSNWAIFFIGAQPEALEILRQLICFVSSQRLTADEALKHRYVRGFRDASKEFVAVHGVHLPLDDNTRFGRLKYLEKILENFVGEE